MSLLPKQHKSFSSATDTALLNILVRRENNKHTGNLVDGGDQSNCPALHPSSQDKLRVYKSSEFPFPVKLHSIISHSKELGLDHIISWLPNGHAFMVHKPKDAVDKILRV